MSRLPRSAFYVLFTISGFAGLIYESLWTHYLKLYLGHAAYAQSLVLAVFMGGMAAGAAAAGRHSARIGNPLAAYALVEAVIGLFSLGFHEAFVLATDWSHDALLPALGSEWLALGAKLALSCALILPQSVLLGATFPLMSAGLARAHPAAAGESVAMLYFTNSLGACAGVLAAGFVLIESLGLPGTLRAAGWINLALAAAVWAGARGERRAPLAARTGGAQGAATVLLAAAFLTGLASFVYEIGWIRMLSLVLGASTHSFELMLATFILGLALGGLAARRLADAAAGRERLLGSVQVAKGLAALGTLPLYDASFGLMETLMNGLARTATGYALFNLSGQAIAAMVMLPATFLAGMTLPLLTGALLGRGAGEAAIGKVYAANTLGAIAGVALAVHVGLPLLGLKGSLVAGALVDAALGLALLYRFAATARRLAWALAACAALFLPLALVFELDVNKMSAGVYRYGDLAVSRDAEVLFAKDGKTATVHLVKYSTATSIRTNGKSDGSIDLDAQGPRGTDEITMVLTGALPLALKPEARTAAVIGIGTGLTTHTLLQSLDIERVETVEIEPAMAQAARGFMPRNSAAFADPRGTILIDDAKTFFATRNRRYDLIISEPSNPWVSGVSGLFTREFYRRIRTHLGPRGLLVQWMQLYEIDASLVASVMLALGEVFEHYAVFAASDHDLLIVAGDAPIPLPAQARVFEHPGLAKELWTVHVFTAGDFDARYLGARATLEPLFASYGMPANSDYAPVLDLNAARHRYMEKSAADIVGLLNAEVPVLELLEPARSRRPVNALFGGAYALERVENTRRAWYARNFLVGSPRPVPDAIPTQLQKDLEIAYVRLVECREPRELDVWLHGLLRVARSLNPYLARDDVDAVWARLEASPCYGSLEVHQRRWIALHRAVGRRDAERMAAIAADLLEGQADLSSEAREYLLMAAMAGNLAGGRRERALELWRKHRRDSGGAAAAPAFRLLRCHAAPRDCAADFRAYAER
jgi:predicted membrane-bound spermidine synthase